MQLKHGPCPLKNCDCDGRIFPGDRVFYKSGDEDAWVQIWGWDFDEMPNPHKSFWIGRGSHLDPDCIQEHVWFR